MDESVARPAETWRERKLAQRAEERTVKLIYRLKRAVELLKADAERNGFVYGKQSVPLKALKELEKWEQERKGKQM
jgi:hypothetical protein